MTSSDPSTHIEARPQAAPSQIINTSLPLYILVEKRPTPDNPHCVEIGCGMQRGVRGMLVYRSLIDAMLERYTRNRHGGNYLIAPFGKIDPSIHLRDHNNRLTVYLAYGFAARGPRLLLNAHGDLCVRTQGSYFDIPPETAHHFHLNFSVEWMETLHAKARMHDYDEMVRDLAEASTAEIERLARAALQRIDKPVSDGDSTHCALYDHFERRWRFVANEDVELPGAWLT